MLRKTIRDFVQREVKPLANKIDKEGKIPQHLFEMAKELGLYGISFPEEYGGAGGGAIEQTIVSEELAHGCSSFAGRLGAHGLAMTPILLAGTDAQKKKYLTPLAKGEKIGCFALTEAEAGSDASNIQTTAVKDGNQWIINGRKTFITNADIADILVVFTLTDKNLRAMGGITTMIVERDTPGLEFGKIEEKMGMRGMHSIEIFFTDVKVPVENTLGRVGLGFKVAMQTFDITRHTVAASCLGMAKEVLDLSIAYAKQRVTFGKPIIEHQAVGFMLTEMATWIYAMESMVYRTAWLIDQGKLPTRESAMCKYFCSEMLSKIVDMALQIHAGVGYHCELPIERFYRDSRLNRIIEGTSEIQQLVILRDLAKKGRY
jgi:acyl-CoA dehydrogenase